MPSQPLRPDFGACGGLPRIPEIIKDHIRLQVFTHRSFYARPTHMFDDFPHDPSPDNEMFEHLGDSVLGLVVTLLLRDMFPYLRVGPSTKIRAMVVGNSTLASISLQYRLPDRLRLHPAQAITLRASAHIQADVFESYVGGLFTDQGLEVVQLWLNALLRPYVQDAYRIVREQHGLSPSPPSMPDSAPVPALPPSWSNPAPSLLTPTVGHLSLFNQHLQQQSKYVEWVYADGEGEGTKTTPIWNVRAMVNSECLGTGRGPTKKAAKNQAAKEGLTKMGVYIDEVLYVPA